MSPRRTLLALALAVGCAALGLVPRAAALDGSTAGECCQCFLTISYNGTPAWACPCVMSTGGTSCKIVKAICVTDGSCPE